MRLTLRTMLSYLDDLLEPADAQEIARKIENSEFASDIVQKTRASMQKLRLGAPALAGKEMGIDPNTVAEYLDYTLPDDRVPDFERACLAPGGNSEMHLAEVASCHQILALVLQGPPEILATTRERMYRLAEQVAVPAPAAAIKPTPAPEEKPRPAAWTQDRESVEVPEELRDLRTSGRFWRLAAAAMLLVGLGMAVIMAVQPQWAKNLLSRGRQNVAENGFQPNDKDSGTSIFKPVKPLPPPADWGDDDQPSDDGAVKEKTKPDGETPDGLQQPDDVAAPDDMPPDSVVVDDEPPAPVPTDDEPPTPTDEVPFDDSDEPPAAVVEKPQPPIKPVPPVAPENVEPAGETIARYVSNNSVLVRYNPKSNEWDRLPQQQSLARGDSLLALPLFDATLALSNAVTLQLKGDTQLELMDLDAEGVPTLRLIRGRLVMSTVGKAQTRVRLEAAGRRGMFTCGNGDSTVAIEVQPIRVEGVDPGEQPPAWRIDLYEISGSKVVWTGEDGQSLDMSAPSHRTLGLPESDAEKPAWYNATSLNSNDKRAAENVEEQLRHVTADRSTTLILQELAEDRRKEVRSLAVRCLAAIGRFEPLVNTLSKADLFNSWSEHIETLRSASCRGPDPAAALRKAIASHRGEKAADLYRMLWGYSEEQLKQGEAEKLVDYLEHPDLDFRVLSYWNLKNITGKSLNYRPENPDVKRKQGVKEWRLLASRGQINYPKRPEPKNGAKPKPEAAPKPAPEPDPVEAPAEKPKSENDER